jgi:hypothetical protein
MIFEVLAGVWGLKEVTIDVSRCFTGASDRMLMRSEVEFFMGTSFLPLIMSKSSIRLALFDLFSH